MQLLFNPRLKKFLDGSNRQTLYAAIDSSPTDNSLRPNVIRSPVAVDIWEPQRLLIGVGDSCGNLSSLHEFPAIDPVIIWPIVPPALDGASLRVHYHVVFHL